MTDNRTPNAQQQQASATQNGKKPYRKPAFRYERVFETAALICGKITNNVPNCISSHKTS
jgi:hypothetical protein